MSHLQTYECTMPDKGILADACRRLGWTMVTGQCVRSYASQTGPQCDAVIEFPATLLDDNGQVLGKTYNIGVQLDTAGRVGKLLHDDAMNGRAVMRNGEQDSCTQRVLGLLKQAYQISAAKRVAVRKGYRVTEVVHSDGRVEMQVRGNWR